MLRPRPNIEKISPAAHGGIDYQELKRLGIAPEDVTDFSVSVNPFGPPPGVAEAIAGAAVDRYPDSESTELREALAKNLHVPPEAFIVGAGSTEIIRLISSAYFGPEDLVMIPEPTYGEYEVACHLSGARVFKASMPGEADFGFNVTRLVGLIDEYHPSGIFLCNPNNPTGHYWSRQDMGKILYEAGKCLVVLDEAYVAFTEDAWQSTELLETGNVVAVRSMTKDYGLAGLRLGYAMASPRIVSGLRRVKPPWNVSSVAQAAGIFALNSGNYLEECGKRMKEAKGFLVEGLQQLGFSPLPSRANFFLVKVGDAAGFRKALLGKGIIVRDCSSFGLPNYIRLAPRTISECRKLLSAIDSEEVHGAR